MSDATAPTIEGYLEKQRVDKKKSKWTKRWFVLRGNQLSYYETNKSKQAKATHILNEGGSVTCHFDKLQFEVVTDGYARNFRASNFNTFRDWVGSFADTPVLDCLFVGCTRTFIHSNNP